MTRIGVVGAGAIGGFLAAALARAGVSVVAVARGEHAAAMQRSGLRVQSDLGGFTARLDVTEDLRTASASFDYLLLTLEGAPVARSARHARAVRGNDDVHRRA